MALPHDPQLAVVTVLVPHLADQVDHLLEDEEADHGHEPHEAEPDCLLVLGVVVLVLPAAPVTALVAQPGIIIVININIITNYQHSMFGEGAATWRGMRVAGGGAERPR